MAAGAGPRGPATVSVRTTPFPSLSSLLPLVQMLLPGDAPCFPEAARLTFQEWRTTRLQQPCPPPSSRSPALALLPQPCPQLFSPSPALNPHPHRPTFSPPPAPLPSALLPQPCPQPFFPSPALNPPPHKPTFSPPPTPLSSALLPQPCLQPSSHRANLNPLPPGLPSALLLQPCPQPSSHSPLPTALSSAHLPTLPSVPLPQAYLQPSSPSPALNTSPTALPSALFLQPCSQPSSRNPALNPPPQAYSQPSSRSPALSLPPSALLLLLLLPPSSHSPAHRTVGSLGAALCPQPLRTDGRSAQGQGNEPHSLPAAGIWHVIVLGHPGRSDAICWHVLPQHRLSTPLSPQENNRGRERAAKASQLHGACARGLRRRGSGEGVSEPLTSVSLCLQPPTTCRSLILTESILRTSLT